MSVRPSGGATDEDSGEQMGDVPGAGVGPRTGAATGEAARGHTLLRMIASAPWVVVLVGVAVLAVLLVVALLSFRGPERPAAWAPGPPIVLPTGAGQTPESAFPESPTAPPTGSAATATPTGPAAPGVSSVQPVDPSHTGSAPPRSGASRSPSLPASTPPAQTGTVTASYRVQDSGDAESFEAQLVIRNGTGRSSDWQVELRFTSGVTGVRASSGPGVSVTIKGSGWYLLSGTGQLAAGAQQSVQLRFSRTGGGEYPALCTVNGATCGMG